MSISLYRMHQKALKFLPFTGRMMPYDWGALSCPLGVRWMPYSMMFDEFSRELANAINGFTNNIERLRAWVPIVATLSDRRKVDVTREFVDTLATNAVNTPYVLRSRFIFAAAHLCHQANQAKGSNWKDDLPLDHCIYMEAADLHGKRWRKYGRLKLRLQAIGGKAYNRATHDFRNAYQHRFSPHFLIGMTGFVMRTVDKPTGQVAYHFGYRSALDVALVVELLVSERDRCYLAFDAFQELVREHENSINKFKDTL
jgi:hypothetical protein